METLTDRDLRDLLFALAAVELGHARTQDVGVALQKALDEPSREDRSVREALIEVAGLDQGQIREIEPAAEKRLADAAGDVQAALQQTGGLLRAVHAQFAQTVVGETVRLGLESVEGVAKDRLREAPPGRYVDFEAVGAGGMGIVYLALDSDLNREVAFKIVNPRAFEGKPPTAGTPSQLSPPEEDTPASKAFATLKARFLQEALITGHLSHPSIVPVYEVGQTPGGVPYYTMKFVRGERTFGDEIAAAETLEDRLGLLEPFLDLCDAVAYAHEQGVVHRDLKPGNVQRGSFGETVLLDWGLARTKSVEDEAADDRWRQRIAELRGDTGLKTIGVLGTPGYMAPEALQGDPSAIDERSDQYSLGVILFQVLTGRLPHELDTSGGDLAAAFSAYRRLVQSQDAPRADAVNPAIPRELADLCARALSRVPQERLGSVAELAEAVRAWQRESARRQQRAERRTAVARMGLVSAVALLVVVAGFLWRTDVLRRRASAARAEAEGQRQLAEQREHRLYERLDDAYWEAYRKFAERGEAAGRLLVACAAIENMEAHDIDSPRCWRFLADDALKNCPRLIATSPGPNTWLSPEGTLLAYGPEDGKIKVRDLTSGQMRGAVPVDPEGGLDVDFGRDEATILVRCRTGSREQGWKRTVTFCEARTGAIKATFGDDEALGAGRSWSWYGEVLRSTQLSPDRSTLAIAGRGDRAGTVGLWDVPTGERKATLQGHAREVSSLGFTPDSAVFVSASKDGEIKVWDLRTCSERGTLRGHPVEASQLAFTPDSATLASGSKDGTVRVWNLSTCSERTALNAPAGLDRLALSPDGKSLVTSSEESTGLKLWDLATATEKLESPGEDWVGEWFFTGNGMVLAKLGAGPPGTRGFWLRRAWFWDVASGRRKAEVEFPEYFGWHSVRSAISPDRATLAVRLSDRTLGLWDTATGQQKGQLVGLHRHSQDAVFSPDGKLLAVGDRGGTIKLWDLTASRPIMAFRGHRDPIVSLRFGADRAILRSVDETGLDRIWDVRVGRDRTTQDSILSPDDVLAHRSRFSPAGDTLVCNFPLGVAGRGAFVLYDVPSGRMGATGRGWQLDLSPDGSVVAVAEGGEIVLRDVCTRRQVASLSTAHAESWNLGVMFSPDGTTLASFRHMGGAVKLWDVSTGQLLASLSPEGSRWSGHGAGVVFSRDGDILASFGRDGTIRLWDVAARREKAVLRGPPERADGSVVTRVCFSPDGSLLAASAEAHQGLVSLWDVRTKRELATIDGHSAAFSPDGTILAAAHGERVQLWNVAPLQKARTLEHETHVGGLSFSPDGSRLAVVSDRLVFWDVDSGIEITRSPGKSHGETVGSFTPCFSLDGTTLAWSAASPLFRVWDVSVSEAPSPEEAVRITGCRLDGFRVEPDARRPEAGEPVLAAGADPDRGGRAGPPWNRRSPNRWRLGASQGDAESLYRLAVVRERQHRDAEARAFHRKAGATLDPADQEWAGRSRSRLKLIPWLQDWFPVVRRAEDLFTAGDDDGGLEAFHEDKALSAQGRAEAARELVLRRAMIATKHFGAGEYTEAERQWRIAVQVDSRVLNECWPDWAGLRLVGHTMEPLLEGDYDSWLAQYEQARTNLPVLGLAAPGSISRHVLSVMGEFIGAHRSGGDPGRREAEMMLKVATEFALASGPDVAPEARQRLFDAWERLASDLRWVRPFGSDEEKRRRRSGAERALEVIGAVVSHPPQTDEAAGEMADTRAQATRFGAGRIYCRRKAAQLFPGMARPVEGIADACVPVGRLDEAVAELRRAIEIRGTGARAECDLALIHLLQGDSGRAVTCYSRALQTSSPGDHWLMEDIKDQIGAILDCFNGGMRLAGDRYVIAFLCDRVAARTGGRHGHTEGARVFYKAYIDEEPAGQFVEAAKKRLAELAEE